MAQGQMSQQYYSARLLHVAIVGGSQRRRKLLCDESVFLFRAKNTADAFRRALRIGRAKEHEYRNKHRQLVRWAFADVLSMSFIGRSVDGEEVSSRLHDRVLPKPASLRHKFHPERSKPPWL
jgi:hypothetical protein